MMFLVYVTSTKKKECTELIEENYQLLAKTIIKLSKDKNRQLFLTQNAKDFVDTYFYMEINAKKYLIYTKKKSNANNSCPTSLVFNRKDKTIECLRRLYNQLPIKDYIVDVYLTNDGCTDGTPEAVKQLFPQVHIIDGDGSLFWNRGMYIAWQESSKKKL